MFFFSFLAPLILLYTLDILLKHVAFAQKTGTLGLFGRAFLLGIIVIRVMIFPHTVPAPCIPSIRTPVI